MVNYDWLSRFPTGRVRHLHCYTSDHRPILLSLDSNGENQWWKRKPFWFEAMWLTDLERSGVISTAWACNAEGSPMVMVTKKVAKCKKMLKAWNRDRFGNVLQKIKRTKELLWRAKEEAVRSRNDGEVRSLKQELAELYAKEEKMWHQRSLLQWLQCGDQNTKFFHGSATQRKRRNFIKGLKDAKGAWHEDEDHISSMFTAYIVELFMSSNPHDLYRVLDGVQNVVTDDMRADLAKQYLMEKVEFAIKEIALLKAPGLDGMPPLFYQTYWSEVGMDISQAVLSSLNSGSLLKSINHTFITIIPKVQNPERVNDFRPTSLCNVIYKIVSKVITNRLKPLLNSIISEAQSAFTADRLITDNILIAFESVHHMKNTCTRNKGFMALKLDMSKAYDRVEWLFLEKILLRMGFQES